MVKSKMGDELEELVAGIEGVKILIKLRLPAIKKQINQMINCRIKSPAIIEKVLDELLDYSYFGYGEKEFRKLNAYYSTFYPEFARSYQEFYQESIDSMEK